MEGLTDGTCRMTGDKFFHCPDGRGLYYPLEHLKPDERFTDPGTTPGVAGGANCKYCIRECGSVLYLGMAKEISKYHTDAPAGKRPKKPLPPKPSRMILPSSSQKHSQTYLRVRGSREISRRKIPISSSSSFFLSLFLID